MKYAILFLWGCLSPSFAHAWSEHGMLTAEAISGVSEIQKVTSVPGESLAGFLQAEQDTLMKLLAAEEGWLRRHQSHYPKRPDALIFVPTDDADLLVKRFLRAIRVNPELQFQTPAAASAKDILIAASDEPDQGLDIGLFENNGTAFGKEYGFGKQPFGNPLLSYGSQAPFHMGFYNEAWLSYQLAGYLRRTYPEFRIHLFRTLSEFSFQKGHAYWGYRFAGWAIHYIQDFTQPYHSTVVPGIGSARLLWLGVLDLFGNNEPKADQVQLVTNRHLVLEKYEAEIVKEAVTAKNSKSILLQALREMSYDEDYGRYYDGYARAKVAFESNWFANDTDAILEKTFPAKWVSDPSYHFSITEPDIQVLPALKDLPADQKAEMEEFLANLMRHFGSHTRNFLKSVQSYFQNS
ncbi:hypothetical protein K2X30_14985 [bacterium]|nr:hypothetical protein [bacterium]